MKHSSLTTHPRTAVFPKPATRGLRCGCAGLLLTTLLLTVSQAADNRAPNVPAGLEVPQGNKVSFHAYATGVQIYVWTQSPADPTQFSWVFKAPEATLYDSNGNVVGIHYAGPTWESNSGSKVVAARVAGTNITSGAIPWLLLRATSTQGPGIFRRTTFIHRVNTAGGVAPSTPGSAAGEEARVPYTADYYFYRAK